MKMEKIENLIRFWMVKTGNVSSQCCSDFHSTQLSSPMSMSSSQNTFQNSEINLRKSQNCQIKVTIISFRTFVQ